MVADEIIKGVVGSRRRAGLNFITRERRKGWRGEDFAGQADADAKVVPILRVRHVVEGDPWRGDRIGRSQADRAARL